MTTVYRFSLMEGSQIVDTRFIRVTDAQAGIIDWLIQNGAISEGTVVLDEIEIEDLT